MCTAIIKKNIVVGQCFSRFDHHRKIPVRLFAMGIARATTVHQSPDRWAEPVPSDVSVVSGTPRANVSQSSVNRGSVLSLVVSVVRPLVATYHNRWSTYNCNLKTSRIGPSHAYFFFLSATITGELINNIFI